MTRIIYLLAFMMVIASAQARVSYYKCFPENQSLAPDQEMEFRFTKRIFEAAYFDGQQWQNLEYNKQRSTSNRKFFRRSVVDIYDPDGFADYQDKVRFDFSTEKSYYYITSKSLIHFQCQEVAAEDTSILL